ncbi:GNAT family N-acetyltransferase [Halobaculum sp. MBLA0143]|uniref:GNAT family N-acetyltransferase n=1 Tax=Halobaculum sp. MBLA0143 TaxID=3079933 RepID=UPI00352515F5
MPGSRLTHDPETGVGLRTVEPTDAQFLQQCNARPALRYPLGSRVRAAHEVETEVEDGERSDRYVVCLGDDGDPPPEPDAVTRVGAVSVSDADWRRPELGYWLVPEHHGRGYGKAAVGLLVDHVFRTVDHPAVGAVAYGFNDASRGLLESLGFEEEGRTRRDRFVDGEYVDTVHYGLLREDWWADRPRSWREASAQDDV